MKSKTQVIVGGFLIVLIIGIFLLNHFRKQAEINAAKEELQLSIREKTLASIDRDGRMKLLKMEQEFTAKEETQAWLNMRLKDPATVIRASAEWQDAKNENRRLQDEIDKLNNRKSESERRFDAAMRRLDQLN